MSVLTSVVVGVALLVIGAGGWIWATVQGGFDIPVLHRSPPYPVLTLVFFFVMILGPTLFCLLYPLVRTWILRKHLGLRILLAVVFAAVVLLDLLILYRYTSWVYAVG